jgi:hypothetical protein
MNKETYDFSEDSFVKVAEEWGYTETRARDLYKALLNRRTERIKLYSLPGAMDFDKPTKDTFIELKADLKEYFKSYTMVEQILNNFIGE